MNIYWGDIHNHCDITYGYGSLENALAAARKQLDFCSVTPHAMWPDIPEITPESEYLVRFHQEGFAKIARNWEAVKGIVEGANEDGEFVTFHTFEMHSSKYGDHHIVSPDDSLELIRADTPHEAARRQRCRAIAVPHHIAYSPGYRGIDWNFFDETASPIVEVYSKHGSGMKDEGDFPYLHTMGPKDSRNTAYAGLRAGKKFSFAASTDHHAGFPGSYGDGKLAVLAAERTRSAIWEGILAGRTYAVTGDKILCEFSVNEMPFGSRIPDSGGRLIHYRVEGGGAIDRIVICHNLRPIEVILGELREAKGAESRYKVRLELGWGDEPRPYPWTCVVRTSGGSFVGVEPCIRGRSVLAPSPDQKDDPDINKLHIDLRMRDETTVEFDCETVKNPSTAHAQTSAIIMEVEGDEETTLDFAINGHRLRRSVGELLKGSITGQERAFASPSFRIHGAVPRWRYMCEGSLVINAEKLCNNRRSNPDFYHMEVRQVDGSTAYVSPIYIV